jgi:hypothetical protein
MQTTLDNWLKVAGVCGDNFTKALSPAGGALPECFQLATQLAAKT